MKTEIFDRQGLIDGFHKLFYEEAGNGRTWAATKWFGTQMLKSPFDMFLYADLIWEVKPALIIETGTWSGGSALFFAHLLDQLSHGRVMSIDLQPMKPDYPRHPRIDYIGGASSVNVDTVAYAVAATKAAFGPVMVVLDSDHSKAHVLNELGIYASFVTPGSYLILEDVNINGNPVFPDFGPGPAEALAEWLPRREDYKDETARMNKYLFTFNAWLKRRRM